MEDPLPLGDAGAKGHGQLHLRYGTKENIAAVEKAGIRA
jgi:hypothetical protein